MKNADIQKDLTKRIVDAITSTGKVPWRKPWTPGGNCGSAKNVFSRKPYRGINPLLLEVTSLQHGFTSCWWATMKQWNDLKLSIMPRPKHAGTPLRPSPGRH